MRKASIRRGRKHPVQMRHFVSRSVAPCKALVILLVTVAASIKTMSKVRLTRSKQRWHNNKSLAAVISGLHLSLAARVPAAIPYVRDMRVLHAKSFYFLHSHNPYGN